MEQQLSTVEKELLEAVEQKRRENPKLQYHEALKLVASERPELNRRYTRNTRQMMTGRDD
jgi:hypothetical protein